MDQWESNLFLYSWETYIYGVILLYSIYRELLQIQFATHLDGRNIEKATLYIRGNHSFRHKHHISCSNDFKWTLYKLFYNNELLIKRFASYDFDKGTCNFTKPFQIDYILYQTVVKLLWRTRLSRRLILKLLPPPLVIQ